VPFMNTGNVYRVELLRFLFMKWVPRRWRFCFLGGGKIDETGLGWALYIHSARIETWNKMEGTRVLQRSLGLLWLLGLKLAQRRRMAFWEGERGNCLDSRSRENISFHNSHRIIEASFRLFEPRELTYRRIKIKDKHLEITLRSGIISMPGYLG